MVTPDAGCFEVKEGGWSGQVNAVGGDLYSLDKHTTIQKACLTGGSAGIPGMERTLFTVSSRIVITKQKVPMSWHKHTVSCCIATAITGKLVSKCLTSLMDLASISRVTKKTLKLVSEVKEIVRVRVPVQGAKHTKSQEGAIFMVIEQ